jgi:HEAT repeat protein
MFKRIVLCVVFLIMAGSVTAFPPAVPDEQDDVAKAYKEAYKLVLAEEWQKSIAALDAFIKAHSKSRYVDDARFWQCYAREKTGEDLESVFQCYNNFVETYPKSKWTDDARSNMVRIGHKLAKMGKSEYKALVQAIEKDEDEDINLTALYALQNTGDEKALELTLDLYDKTSNEEMRSRILYILGSYDSPRVVPKLLEIARTDPSSSIRQKAVYALQSKDTKKIRAELISLMETSRDSKVRRAVLHSLAGSGDPDVVPMLAKIARDGSDRDLARTAVYALSGIEDPAARQALQSIILEVRDTKMRTTALMALAAHANDTKSMEILKTLALTDSSSKVRRTALHAIASTRSDEAFAILQQILTGSEDERMQEYALYAMSTMEDRIDPDLLKEYAISNASERLARAAVHALIGSMDEKAKAENQRVLMEILEKSRHERIKEAVMHQMLAMGPEQGLPMLIRLAGEGSSLDIRRNAVRILGQSESDEAVSVLLEIVKSDAPLQLRKEAVRALGQIGTPKAQEALMKILDQKNEG